MSRSTAGRARVVALTLALATAAAACGDDGGSPSSDAAPADPAGPSSVGAVARATPTDPAVAAGTELVVAEQSGGESIPWHASGAGDDAPYDVTFANFNGGSAVIEALRSGGADIGALGEAPLPIAVGAGVDDVVAVAVEANPGSSGNYYLVVQPGSGIETVVDLEGHDVAFPPGTGRHMILASILADAGLELGRDVEAVELAGTEVAPTFASGAVDAAMVLGAQLFKLGEPPVLADGTGHNTGINVLAVRRDTLDHPAKVAAIGDYVRRTMIAGRWSRTHLDEYVEAVYVDEQGITAEQGRQLVDEAGLGSYYPIDDDVVATFQSVADGLVETGAVPTPIDVAPFVDDRFNDVIEAQNAADGVTLAPLSPA